MPEPDLALYRRVASGVDKLTEILVPPREAACFRVVAGHVFRISSVLGPQVGDLKLWYASDLSERFYLGKTRALHGAHLTTGDRMWSSFPQLRPMATLIHDSLN